MLTVSDRERTLGWCDAEKIDLALTLPFGLGGLNLSLALARSLC